MQMGSPELDSGNIWEIYCYIVEQLQDITRRRASEDDNYFDAVDEWQVSEFLQDNESREEAVPLLPLIQGRSLFGGYDDPRPDGSLYFGGVNEGRGLDTALEARLDDMEDDDEFEVEEFYEGEGEGITFSEDEHGEEEERDEW
ncbi:hypothetical protein BDN70DRAFT_925811 [Pholiota conissans]|uniref:Uncharacterized protein n=1 Tax=Pholiota conissans TaxID=109636 RepID=A0A9P5YR45_9AGAR|nr:hypothetical protein BDN70DRAFT_925811 [Pholiota conissans]